MSSDRTTMTVRPSVKEVVDEHKRADETYDEFFVRVFGDGERDLTDDQATFDELARTLD